MLEKDYYIPKHNGYVEMSEDERKRDLEVIRKLLDEHEDMLVSLS